MPKEPSSVTPWYYPSLQPPPKKKQPYTLVPTILDQFNEKSELNLSSFKGFFNMASIFCIAFLFTKPIVNWFERGYFLEPYLYETFKNDYVLCLLVWPLFFTWSFTSYILQKMVLLGVNPFIITIFQHLTQAGLFIFSSYLILTRNWCSTHAAFVIMQACVHFMKMHSYTTVNRDYREQKLQAEKEGTEVLSNYPKNISIKDFVLFMWTPWLVYDKYPRKATRSIVYIIKKSLITLLSVLMTYIIHTDYLQPEIESGGQYNYIQLIFKCMIPGTFILLMFFYIVFEGICNVFAEITKLDHRFFYEDWWNSTTYEEFNRKWNRPVHIFLYRHVYLELILRWKFSKNRAQMVTFLFSAALHEFLLAIIFRIVRPIFLGFIIFQVPLIYFTKFMHGKKIGSYLFWLGLLIGPSIIIACYLKVSDDVQTLFLRHPVKVFTNFTEEI